MKTVLAVVVWSGFCADGQATDALMRRAIDQHQIVKSRRLDSFTHGRPAHDRRPVYTCRHLTRGKVVASKRAGKYRGHAELAIVVNSIVLPDGSLLPVTGETSASETRSVAVARRQRHPNSALTSVYVIGAGYVAAAIASLPSGKPSEASGFAFNGAAAGIVALRHIAVCGDDLELPQGMTINVVFHD